MEYKKFSKALKKSCDNCTKEYSVFSNTDLYRYPNYCPTCSSEYGKLVYKCNQCGTNHFHQFTNCSVCPGKTIHTYYFCEDGTMNRVKAWKEAGKDSKGKW